MAEPNYAQALVQKKFLQHEASLEFNSIQSVYFVRGALHAQEIAKTDNLTIEFINRTNRNAAFGWSATIDKHLDHAQRWLAGLTYSDLPMKMFNKSGTQILLNSAGLGCGKVFGPVLHYSPAKNVEMFVYTSRRIDGENPLSARWRLQVGIRYQLSETMNSLLNEFRFGR